MGESLSKAAVGTGDALIILYGELYTAYGNYIVDVVSRADYKIATKGTELVQGDIVMPITNTTKEVQIGKASATLMDEIYI